MRTNNSVVSRFKEKNGHVLFISGCHYHLAHIAASHSNNSFSNVVGFNVEYLCIDLFHWFDKSSKLKENLGEYFQFCDQEYYVCA